jgi:hypothetical protein
MNAVVGFATGLVMWACGVGDPVLWGVVVFLLNYIPIMGPLFGFILFCIVDLPGATRFAHLPFPVSARIYFKFRRQAQSYACLSHRRAPAKSPRRRSSW